MPVNIVQQEIEVSSPLEKFRLVLKERVIERQAVKNGTKPYSANLADTLVSNSFNYEIPYGISSALVSREAVLNKQKLPPFHNTILCTRKINVSETFHYLLGKPMPQEFGPYNLFMDDNRLLISDVKNIDTFGSFMEHLDRVVRAYDFDDMNPKSKLYESTKLINKNSLIFFKEKTTPSRDLGVQKSHQVTRCGTISLIELPDRINNNTYRVSDPTSQTNSKDLLLIFKDKNCDMKTFMKNMMKSSDTSCISSINRERGIRLDLFNEAKYTFLFNKDCYLLSLAREREEELLYSRFKAATSNIVSKVHYHFGNLYNYHADEKSPTITAK